MYWLSVSALGALVFFYLKGRTQEHTEPTEEGAGPSEARNTSAKKPPAPVEKESGVNAAKQPEDSVSFDIEKADDPEQIRQELKKASNSLERHLLYTKGVDLAYKKRKADKKMARSVKTLASDYVGEFGDMKKTVFKQLGTGNRLVPVFKQFAILLEEEKEYEKAVRVCEKALSFKLDDGTKTGYEGRILRLKKKMAA